MTRPTPVAQAAIWAMAGQYGAFALQFATSVVISRYFLTPGEVGLFSIALAAALLVAVLQDFGLGRYIAGLRELDADEVARCSTVAVLFAGLVAATIAVASWPLGWAYRDVRLAPLLQVIALSYVFVPFSVVPLALMARAMQFRGHAMVNVAGACAQGAVAIAMAAAGQSAMALAAATVAAAVARAVVAQVLRPSWPRRWRWDGLARVVGFGARASVLYLTGALGTRSPDLIVGKALGLLAVGLYSRAVGLSDQLRMLVAGAIGSVFYPAFARLRDRGEPLAPAYLRVCAGYSGVVWPAMAGLAVGAPALIALLYGPRWAATAPCLRDIALAEVMLTTLPLVSDLPILAGRLNALLARNLVDTVLSLLCLAVGCRWGVEGAAASRLVYAALWFALYARFMAQIVGFGWGAWARLQLLSGLVTLAAIAPLSWLVRDGAVPGFAALGGAVAAGGVCWLVALVLVRHPLLAELTRLLGHRRRDPVEAAR